MFVTRRLLPTISRRLGGGGKHVRYRSHAALESLKPISNDSLVWKANQDDPLKHTNAHEGLFYQLPYDDKQLLQIFGTRIKGDIVTPFGPERTTFYRTIGMFPIMIRRPFLDASKYLNNLQPNLETLRMLFYGDIGHGKSHTLVHLTHYLHRKQEHFIVHVKSIKKFTRSPLSIDPSASRPGRIDTNTNAALTLDQFRIQNANLLERHGDVLKCTNDYTWSVREVTKAGEPLVNVIEHGINRTIHASDCLAVLIKELLLAADAGLIRLATIIDNVQFLFYREAGVLKHPDHKRMLVDEITVARALKKLIKRNYKNGLVLATCDDKLNPKLNLIPQDVIGQEGWDHFDPFLPVPVPKYSRKEFESCMNFYQDIGWLTRPEAKTVEARDELRFISGMNPGQVHYFCQSL